jgi:hypothetical protein
MYARPQCMLRVILYLLITIRYRITVVDACINEAFVVIQLQHFKFCHICPLHAVIDFIELEGFLIIARDLITKFILRGTSERLELCLSD